MGIFKYTVLNPIKDPKQPFYDEKKGILYIPLKTLYRYYVECCSYNEDSSVEYYILLGLTKFDNNCRLCHTDNYGRVQVKLKSEIKDYVIKESKERGNLIVKYEETADGYDVFSVE